MTDDLLVGDDDNKFELATFSNPRGGIVRSSGSSLFNFFGAVFFVLYAVGIGTPNVEQIQQQLSDKHLFWK